MSSDTKKRIGDGDDNYGQAAKNAGKAAKQLGSATKQGAEAAANAATVTVNAGVKTGKAVANVAKGTAIGGPWGAIISAAWSMRHTLFKVLVVICLILFFAIITVVFLPLIVIDNILGGSGNHYSGFDEAYNDVSHYIAEVVDESYDAVYLKANEKIIEGGYDTDLSLIVNKDYDKNEKIIYILSAYSVSKEHSEQDISDLIIKLNSVKADLFLLSITEKSQIREEGIGDTETDEIKYLECEISFNDNAVLNGFSVNLDDLYYDSEITKGEMLNNISDAMKRAQNN